MFLQKLLLLHPLWSVVGASGLFYLRNHLRNHWFFKTQATIPSLYNNNETTIELLLKWQLKQGYSEHSLVSILPDSSAWVEPNGLGAVSYLEIGNTWLSAGDPFASDENLLTVASGFVNAARKANKLISFVPTTERLAKLANELDLDLLPVGISPYFDLQSWEPRGDKAKKVRSGVNQARRAGIKVELTPSHQVSEAEIAQLSSSWLETRRTVKFGWLFDLDPLRYKEHKHFFVARDEKQDMVGLLAASPIPMREGWYLEDILRHPTAPNGISDLLIVEAMTHLKKFGGKMATLGTVPIIGRENLQPLRRGKHQVLDTILTGIGNHMEGVYNFQGLYRFKSKFVPTWWETEYAMFPKGLLNPIRLGSAVTRAIAPNGLFQVIREGTWQ
jgi:phosphatidylglycerol lysyltransferase